MPFRNFKFYVPLFIYAPMQKLYEMLELLLSAVIFKVVGGAVGISTKQYAGVHQHVGVWIAVFSWAEHHLPSPSSLLYHYESYNQYVKMASWSKIALHTLCFLYDWLSSLGKSIPSKTVVMQNVYNWLFSEKPLPHFIFRLL